MQIAINSKNDIANNYYVVIIRDFFGPQEAKARLVKADSADDAKEKTKMHNPDVIVGFSSKEDACTFIGTECGNNWTEI